MTYQPLVGVDAAQTPQREFEKELKNKHFQYTYDNGWKYEFHVPNDQRIVYSIHGGPMAGRHNFQTCYYQRVRENLWQANWLEETGTVVSLILDIDNRRITTFMAFSQGHWEHPNDAHGDKRVDLDRWRGLSKIGISTNRYLITEQASIDEIFEGRGDLPEISLDLPTL
ncbi:Piso0_000516 [Millerozyma farinosa CBS 7064]|uniref:Piso0_000516 protein n=1 Tax=Pichia sorbitophila (strain ATCC MYA-4447 / BCRC 22081 / CBS 7064 / NBRC 10061 / NRRL Y-12695) TaxID=559304 RepID=G8YU73_PICSO|nr:Piso0_000516 [Millerozyma farinosa CBS 7064]CCE73474.1 Piso0_000516 [Millerozyma farinosa CBS 7064]